MENALRHVAQTLELAGYTDPRKTVGAAALDIPFRRLLTAYSHADPAPSPQLALPVNTMQAAGMHYQTVDARTRATADLVTTAFFFLLRVREYTMPRPNARTRTVQFRVQAVTFRRADDTVIPHTATVQKLSTASSVPLFLDNQKNGQRRKTVLHTAIRSWFCPVQALAPLVASVMAFNVPVSTPLSYVQPGVHVTAANVTALVH